MHIIYFTSSANASGGSRQALYLARGMHDRGHTVQFLAPAKSMLRNLELAQGIEFITLPESYWQWKQALDEALGTEPHVVIHAFHNKAMKALAVFGTWWRITGRSVACVAHRGVIYPPRNPLPYILPGIQCFAVNSHACLNTLPLLWRRHLGVVVFNGIPAAKVKPVRLSAEVYAELGIFEGAPIVGCVSNNAPVKGVDVLIRGFAKAAIEGAYLVLVGVADEKWRPLCEELAISNRVKTVPRTETVADYLQIYTVFILPSRSESSPNTLLEAMSMGLPALGSNVGGVPECLRDESLLFAPGDYDDLAEKLVELMENPERMKKASQDNLQFSHNFSLDVRLDRMEKIYTRLLLVS